MDQITVTLAPEAGRVRMLVSTSSGEILRAVLGPTATMHPRAASTLLEGLALWHQQRLCVVVCADGPDAGCAMGLFDALGLGERTLHYEVGIAMRDRPARRRTLGGLGNFRDLRQVAAFGAVSR
jgi:hypothetical protein